MKEVKNSVNIDIKPEFGFFLNIYQLKNLYRQGWLYAGLDKNICESVAEHSFALAILCLKYQKDYPETLDTNKMLIMALIHDLPEAIVGDIIPAENVLQGDKLRREAVSLTYLLRDYYDSDFLYKLWLEFESGSSPTGHYVKQMDKIEMLMQALIYQKSQDVDLDSFFITSKRQMENQFFINLWTKLFDEYMKERQ